MWSYRFLTPDGVVVIADQEFAPGTAERTEDRGAVLSALARLATRHPEIQAVLPVRPAGAVDCDVCSRLRELGFAKQACSECGGLRWLPPEPPKPAEPGAAADRGA